MGIKILNFAKDINDDFIFLSPNLCHSNFFPPTSWHFAVFTDDKKILFCSRKKCDGKTIYTVSNSISMGEYFRNRLGLPNGAFVTKEHLHNYGRTDVDFYKIDEESYYMDFSVGKV